MMGTSHKVMDDFEFYKELYQVENDRKDSAQDALGLPVAIVTGLLTFLFYLSTSYDYTQAGVICCIFLILMVIGAIPVMISLFYLIRAFNNIVAGFEYKGLPYPKELFEHRRQLVEHYSKHGNGEDEANEKFIAYLTEKFAEHADHNTLVNDKKMRNIFRAKRFMVYSLVGIGLACIPFGYNFFHKTDPINRVEVVKLPDTPSVQLGQQKAQPQPPNPQPNGRQEEGSDTTPTTPSATAGQAHQGESRTDTNQHRAE